MKLSSHFIGKDMCKSSLAQRLITSRDLLTDRAFSKGKKKNMLRNVHFEKLHNVSIVVCHTLEAFIQN